MRDGTGAQTGRRGAARLAAALALLALGPLSAAADAASPYIHAHRGGALETTGGVQAPAHPEASAAAFEAAGADGFVLEVDVKLTGDDRAVVIHDATLDRTTSCTGRVDALTAAELRADCKIDLLGTAGTTEQLAPGDSRRAPVPTMAEVLAIAERHRSQVNLEIKNVPIDPDFDPGVPPPFALQIAEQIKQSGFPPSRLIVQSFWPANLDVFEDDPYFELAATSFLTLEPENDGGPAFADANEYEYVSPAWPVNPSYIQQAHALGLQVVPYTLDSAAQIKAAAEAGVDAVITNDPGLARRAQKQVEPPAPLVAPAPSGAECVVSRANRRERPIYNLRPRKRAPRVFALQFKQELRHVVTYGDFRTKIECMIRRYVKPHLVDGRPNVVALNEDIGLMTLATGTRGAAARAIFANPDTAPSCESQGVPCGVAAALGAVATGYSAQVANYTARYPSIPPAGATFVAGTDTFARGWMQVFSDMAKRYDIYILGSSNQAPFRESRDPSEIAAFADPDIPTPDTVFVATSQFAYNEVFMWGPREVRSEGPRPLRNIVASNRKVPLTPIEELIQIQPGPSTGPDAVENLRPHHLRGTPARLGFATSKPAFEYGHELGAPPPGVDPCADVSVTYMRCLDALGTNVVIQDEANPGRWPAQSAEGNYQPLEWMRSTWRAVADPDVSFDYNVTPHLVGNLADLPFDGQTAITQRDPAGPRAAGLAQGACTYVGDRRFIEGTDPESLRIYAGPKSEFLGITPWVRDDGPRPKLRDTAAKLAPGSGHRLENDYVESAIVADLPFPVDARRARCVRSEQVSAGACENLGRGTERDDRLRGSRRGDRLRVFAGADVVHGGPGRDCLHGYRGHDRLHGGIHADRIQGGVHADRLYGGRGRDVIFGSDGRDLLGGGPGNDLLRARGGHRDRLHCGPGFDVALAGPNDRVHRSCERVR